MPVFSQVCQQRLAFLLDRGWQLCVREFFCGVLTLGEGVSDEVPKCPLFPNGAVITGYQHVSQSRNWVCLLGGCGWVDERCPKVLGKCIVEGVDCKSGAGRTGDNKFARLVLN